MYIPPAGAGWGGCAVFLVNEGSEDTFIQHIKDTYYTTPDALFRLTDCLDNMGIDGDGKTIRQMLDETPNASLRIQVSHRSQDNSDQIFAEVKRTMKAD